MSGNGSPGEGGAGESDSAGDAGESDSAGDAGESDSAGDAGRSDGDSGAGSARWICEWCEKPHDRNDPPCDNCGHHKFERAVVPVAPSDPDYEREPIWVCPECGRQHQRNSPPCSRCGNASLEKRIPSDDDYADELSGTSYLDVLEPKYAVALVFAVVAGGVLLLGLLGVVSLPGMDGGSLSVSNVPGNATTAGGLSLAEVETEYVARLRAASGGSPTRSERLDDVARFNNQRRVKALAGAGSLPSDARLNEGIGGACESTPRLGNFTALAGTGLGSFDSPRAVAERIEVVPLGSAERVGVDVHALPAGGVSVTVIFC